MLAGVNMAPFLMKFRHRPLSFPHFCVLPIVGTMPLSFLCQLNEVALNDTTAAAYVDESGNLALVNPGEGEIVSKEVGEEERGTGGCVDRRSDDATVVDVEINLSMYVYYYCH